MVATSAVSFCSQEKNRDHNFSTDFPNGHSPFLSPRSKEFLWFLCSLPSPWNFPAGPLSPCRNHSVCAPIVSLETSSWDKGPLGRIIQSMAQPIFSLCLQLPCEGSHKQEPWPIGACNVWGRGWGVGGQSGCSLHSQPFLKKKKTQMLQCGS